VASKAETTGLLVLDFELFIGAQGQKTNGLATHSSYQPFEYFCGML
jgi:hypothetical protein